MRERHSEAESAQAAGDPLGWRGTPPGRHRKGRICNHESKAKWYLKLGEKQYQKR